MPAPVCLSPSMTWPSCRYTYVRTISELGVSSTCARSGATLGAHLSCSYMSHTRRSLPWQQCWPTGAFRLANTCIDSPICVFLCARYCMSKPGMWHGHPIRHARRQLLAAQPCVINAAAAAHDAGMRPGAHHGLGQDGVLEALPVVQAPEGTLLGCRVQTGDKGPAPSAHHGLGQDEVLEALPVVQAPEALGQLRVVLGHARVLGHDLPLAQLARRRQELPAPLRLLPLARRAPPVCATTHQAQSAGELIQTGFRCPELCMLALAGPALLDTRLMPGSTQGHSTSRALLMSAHVAPTHCGQDECVRLYHIFTTRKGAWGGRRPKADRF